MAVKLTAKQRKVLKGLEKGKSPREIAKAMKTGPNNVYGHMKKLRDNGYLNKNNEPAQGEGSAPDSEPVKTDPPSLPPLPEPLLGSVEKKAQAAKDAVHNGHLTKEHSQITELLKQSIDVADARITEIVSRLEEIDLVTEKLATEVGELAAEAESLVVRKDTIQATL